jgi:hypothetical protein
MRTGVLEILLCSLSPNCHHFFVAPGASLNNFFTLHFQVYFMATEEKRKKEIKIAFFEYAEHNELSACDTPSYYARQILPDAPFVAKANVIADLIESGVMVIRGDRWFLRK